MNVRKNFITLCLVVSSILTGAGNSYQEPQSIKCTLKGEVIDRPQSSQLMLAKAGADWRTTQWVSIPIQDGKFEYVLNCNHEEFYQLAFHDEYLNGAWRRIEFISEHGDIHFVLYAADQRGKNIMEGGKLNEGYKDYRIEGISKYKELEPEKSVDEKWRKISENGWINSSNQHQYYQILREDTTYQEWLRWHLNYAKEHPTIVGYSILVSEIRNNKERINDIMPYADVYQTIFAAKYPDHSYTTQTIDLLTGSTLKAGVPYVDFTSVDLNNNPVRLSEQIGGKPAVLYLWASWCGPCRQKGKELIPVYEEFRNKGFTVVGVARERNNMSAAEAAIKLDKYTWKNLVELNDTEQIWVKYGIGNAGGSIFLIDEKGTIVSVAPSIEEIREFLLNKL